MEGQSGDCPFLSSWSISIPPAVPQWRGSRETARSVGPGFGWFSSVRRNGGAVGRLPVHLQDLERTRTECPPQWRGSRETARSSGG